MITSFFHTGFIVADLDQSIKFYQDVFGLTLAGRSERTGEFAESLLGIPNVHIKGGFLDLGAGHQLELIQYLSPEGSRAEFSKNDVRAAHLAFLVVNIEEFYESSKSKGLTAVNSPASLHDDTGKLLRKAMYAQDPDGNWIELVELF
jgi:catechol 2,3-dioxygenase-like lactoylglutathione lyase family enzyme